MIHSDFTREKVTNWFQSSQMSKPTILIPFRTRLKPEIDSAQLRHHSTIRLDGPDTHRPIPSAPPTQPIEIACQKKSVILMHSRS